MKFLLFFLTLLSMFFAFPSLNFDFFNSIFGFICFIPAFFLVEIIKNNTKKTYKDLIFIPLLSISINLILFIWIVPTITMFGINIFLALIFLILLSIYLSFFLDIFFYIFYVNHKNYVFISAIFTILEFIRSHLFTGFPWNLLATTEWKNIYFLQIADIFGIYGISFFVILINLIIFNILKDFLQKKFQLKKIIFLLILFILIYMYGILKFSFFKNLPNKKETLKISLLHDNKNPYEKIDINLAKNSYNDLINQNKNIDLFIMSETSYPYNFYLDQKQLFLKSVKNFFDNFNNNYIIGNLTVENQKNININKIFNSAVLIDKNLNFVDKYDKIHLVPFGEFFPMEKIIFKIFPKLSNNLGGLTKGKNFKNLFLKNFHIAINICYEAIFPELIRKTIFHDTDFILNISNDSWQQRTSAIKQHFVNNIFRAIENRKYLFRVSNMGISAIIDPTGKIIKQTQTNNVARLDYEMKKFDKNAQSFYTKFGNIFLYILLIYIFIIIFYERKFNKFYN